MTDDEKDLLKIKKDFLVGFFTDRILNINKIEFRI